jgi:siroheme synthase (precorrin-2 oxidase/ferrochelatase)
VNDAVVKDARERGILVSRADNDEETPGDFASPAVLRDGAVTIAVSAGGSPALAAAIRTNLVSHVEVGWVRMANLLQVLRPWLAERGELSAEQRRNILLDLASVEAINVVASRGADELWAWLCRTYPELSSMQSPMVRMNGR